MSTKVCRLDWKTTNSVYVSGTMDENADFSSLEQYPNQLIYADLSGITRVNSSGLRHWIRALQRSKIQLVLRECSPAVVEQIAMIPEFVGKNGVVESFFARYQCVSCLHEEQHRVQLGAQSTQAEPQVDQQLTTPCPDCGDAVELDHHTEIYLSFLRQAKKSSPIAS